MLITKQTLERRCQSTTTGHCMPALHYTFIHVTSFHLHNTAPWGGCQDDLHMQTWKLRGQPGDSPGSPSLKHRAWALTMKCARTCHGVGLGAGAGRSEQSGSNCGQELKSRIYTLKIITDKCTYAVAALTSACYRDELADSC